MRKLLERSGFYPSFLLLIFALIWIGASINPLNKSLFILETAGIAVLLLFFILTYRRFRLSNVSYTLIFFYFFLHAIGAHYSYDVPEGSPLFFSFIRYDRLVHLCFGLFMYYPFKDAYLKLTKTVKTLEYLIPFMIIVAIGSIYELWEWVFTLFNPLLGMQYSAFGNDFFDTQKDMALSFLGALIAIIINMIFHHSKKDK